jgi:hypothetical protein
MRAARAWSARLGALGVRARKVVSCVRWRGGRARGEVEVVKSVRAVCRFSGLVPGARAKGALSVAWKP